MSNFNTNEFQPGSAAAWKQKIQFELDGADYNKSLLTYTNEGITIKPFYHSDNFEKVIVPLPKEGFKICKTINIISEEEANYKAIIAIEKGITAILFKASKPFNVSILFKNLLSRKVEYQFNFDFLSDEFLNKLITFLKEESVSYNLDIIGNLARSGNWYTSFNEDFKFVETILKKNPSAFILSVNASIYESAGANTVQQVAYALAHSNEYLTKFGSEIANKIQFKFAIGSNYFFEIAKIRAFRYLYNLILSKYETTTIARVYAEPSSRNYTLYNNNINTLRKNSETISAILGGANTISINTSSYSISDISNYFNSENTKNEQILNNVQYLKNVENLATNCYYIEYLTKQIAEKALIVFKDIEKSGGFLSQIKEGTIQRKITESAIKEQTQFDSEIFLLETNTDLKKAIKRTLFAKKPYKTLIIPILPKRLSEKVEQKILKDEA